jgi:hypothetical protein
MYGPKDTVATLYSQIPGAKNLSEVYRSVYSDLRGLSSTGTLPSVGS